MHNRKIKTRHIYAKLKINESMSRIQFSQLFPKYIEKISADFHKDIFHCVLVVTLRGNCTPCGISNSAF